MLNTNNQGFQNFQPNSQYSSGNPTQNQQMNPPSFYTDSLYTGLEGSSKFETTFLPPTTISFPGNPLFNPEEEEYIDNFFLGLFDSPDLDGQMNFNTLPGPPATSAAIISSNQTSNSNPLLEPEKLDNVHFHMRHNGMDAFKPPVLSDPRLQEYRRSSYEALNLASSYPRQDQPQQLNNSSTSAKTSPSSTSTNTLAEASMNTQVVGGAKNDSITSYALDDGMTTKKRPRARKSTAADKPPKPAKASKMSRPPPLAPLVVSNIQVEDPSKSALLSGPENDTTTDPSSSTTIVAPTSGKSRKSGSRSATTPRPEKELLTDEQKKVNHILSEQRRRALIKEGFELLESLTPSLAGGPATAGPGNTGGGHSKSAVLFAAAQYIQELQAKITGLEQQRGLMMGQ